MRAGVSKTKADEHKNLTNGSAEPYRMRDNSEGTCRGEEGKTPVTTGVVVQKVAQGEKPLSSNS